VLHYTSELHGGEISAKKKKKVDMEATHTHIVYIYIVGNFLHMTHFALLFYLSNPKRKRVKGNDPATLASLSPTHAIADRSQAT
jgi:hypothetical protein